MLRAKRKTSRPDEFVPGVPNTDLQDEDYQALDTEQRKAVRECGLWEVKTDAEMKPASPAKAEQKESS